MILGAFALPLAGLEGSAFTGPVELRVDDLKTPLGIDDQSPQFSWQLQDPARGAKQSAYEVRVSSQPELLASDAANPDVWDSGRIESGKSLNVRYGGPAVTPGTRYFWQVKLWDAAGKPYAESEVSWWETGLLKQGNWRAKWIGYETAEEDAVRHAPAIWIANPDAQTMKRKKGIGPALCLSRDGYAGQAGEEGCALRGGAGYGFGMGQWRAGVHGRTAAGVEAFGVEKVCARGG